MLYILFLYIFCVGNSDVRPTDTGKLYFPLRFVWMIILIKKLSKDTVAFCVLAF